MTPEQLCKSGSEDAHQMALFAWSALTHKQYPMLRWLHAVPNGGLRSARTGAKMKATGARKGIWDVCLPVPTFSFDNGRYTAGLYIEMKKPGTGRLTKEQKEFKLHLDFYGYETAVCFTWEEARDAILAYLERCPAGHIETYRRYIEEHS